MTEVDMYNSCTKPQICEHSEMGFLLRKRGARLFHQVSDDKNEYIEKNREAYVFVPEERVPRSIIRRNYVDDKNQRFMCDGCGKMFKRIQMDGSLCRGWDGCSVKHEIAQLRAENVEPRESVYRHARYGVLL